MTIRIYLDVDGVLNAFFPVASSYPEEATGWSEWKTTTVSWKEPKKYWSDGVKKESSRHKNKSYVIRYSTELVDEINNLIALGLDIVWLTTWRTRAAINLSPSLGIFGSKLRVLDSPEEYCGLLWWKIKALKEDLEDNPSDHSIWIDDDNSDLLAYDSKALSEIKSKHNLSTITPKLSVGLTRTDVRGIIDLINNL